MLKNVASIQIQRVATFNSARKIIHLIPKKSFRYYKHYSHQLSFDAFYKVNIS